MSRKYWTVVALATVSWEWWTCWCNIRSCGTDGTCWAYATRTWKI